MPTEGRRLIGYSQTPFGNTGWVTDMPKAVMCHRPPGSRTRATTIDVSFPEGLSDHLAHGDVLGVCQHGGL